MITEYKENTLFKDLKKIAPDIREKIKVLIFKEFPSAQNFNDINNVKKIKGYKYYFRKKIGAYRIGFKFQNGRITIMRVLHRKDIYKYFP